MVWNDRGTPTPASFYHQTTLGLNCSRKGSPCHPVPSYPASQAPDEQSRKADPGREQGLTPRPHDRQSECFPSSDLYCPLTFSPLLPLLFSHILNLLLKFQPHLSSKTHWSLHVFCFLTSSLRADPGSDKKFSPGYQISSLFKSSSFSLVPPWKERLLTLLGVNNPSS